MPSISGSAAPHRTRTYLLLSLLLPVIWVVAVAVADGYDARFIGVGSDEFRRLINAGAFLTAAMAILAYATKTDLARGYVVVAMPSLVAMDLLARFTLRKRLHKVRALGSCMRRVLVVGHADVVADLAALLRRDSYHGLSVVAASWPGSRPRSGSASRSSPAWTTSPGTVERYEADTVAVLACPEISGVRLRELAWDMEKTGADLCVAPALMDVAGPRTTIRPAAGLPLLHVDHPEFTGARRVIKVVLRRRPGRVGAAAPAAVFLTVVALIIRWPTGARRCSGRPGSAGTAARSPSTSSGPWWSDAEARKADLAELNETDGVLFKMRRDPRVTRFGGWMRKWSLDELPQLINVLGGDMSLVGPRPGRCPTRPALYGDYVRRRLAVKPGITGLWQVNGRADLPGMNQSGWTCATWKTGRWRWTWRSCGRPAGRSFAGLGAY